MFDIMKIFISADIEGVAGTATWDECRKGHEEQKKYAAIMSGEVAAACEGAYAAGAAEVVVKDSHGFGTNIDIEMLPDSVELIRGWSGHPFAMVEGLDETFDAVMFVGYHSAASRSGNALSHTMSGKPAWVRINGQLASEFMIFSFAAASVGVPTVFLAGDGMLCADSASMHPALVTVTTKWGDGSLCRSLTPAKARGLIRAGAEKALAQDFRHQVMAMPGHFEVEIGYAEHIDACKYAYYPGMRRVSDTVLAFASAEYYEVLRMFRFVL